MAPPTLVCWDIDRTLLYVGDIDQLIYQEVFEELIGRPAVTLVGRGLGIPTNLLLHGLFADSGVPPERIVTAVVDAVALLPVRLAEHRDDLVRSGTVMPGTAKALEVVGGADGVTQTVVIGNLRSIAEVKLAAFGLIGCFDLEIGGFASESSYRPDLVRIAQQRATGRTGIIFDRTNTVVMGDLIEDVSTGRIGAARIIGVTSGTTSRDELGAAGADVVLDDLTDSVAVLRAVRVLTRHGTP